MLQRAIQSANRFCKKLINSNNYAYSFLGYLLFSLFKLLLGTFLLLLPSALITAITLITISALMPILGGFAGAIGLGVTLFLSLIFIKAVSPLFKDIFEPYQSINLEIASTTDAFGSNEKNFSNEAASVNAQKIHHRAQETLPETSKRIKQDDSKPTQPLSSLSMFNSKTQESSTIAHNEKASLRLS